MLRLFRSGPLDGNSELVEVEGLKLNVVVGDEPSRQHHYRLAKTPTGSTEPLELEYLYVGPFDPESGYMDDVAREDLMRLQKKS